jgi:hypothetical protein
MTDELWFDSVGLKLLGKGKTVVRFSQTSVKQFWVTFDLENGVTMVKGHLDSHAHT